MSEEKKRNKITPELIRLIKHQVEYGKTNNENVFINNISHTTATKYANLLSVGASETD